MEASSDKMNSATEVDVPSFESVKILAWDYSYSTNKAAHYHRHAKKYLDDFSTTYETTEEQNRPIYLTWSDECSSVTLRELRNICRLQRGTEGTYPSTIISWIQHNIPNEKSIELWLITDGEIGTDELQVCSWMNAGLTYSRINFIVINKDLTNMSVGASFFHNSFEIVVSTFLATNDCGLLLSSEAEGRGCFPLDDHILCKSCNAKRVQALTSHMTTEL